MRAPLKIINTVTLDAGFITWTGGIADAAEEDNAVSSSVTFTKDEFEEGSRLRDAHGIQLVFQLREFRVTLSPPPFQTHTRCRSRRPAR